MEVNTMSHLCTHTHTHTHTVEHLCGEVRVTISHFVDQPRISPNVLTHDGMPIPPHAWNHFVSSSPAKVPLLVPMSEPFEEEGTRVTLMDTTGGILELPYTLQDAVARYLSRSSGSSLSGPYFLFGNVYRQSGKGALPDKQPADFRTAHFGIAAPPSTGHRLSGVPVAEAEVIKVCEPS